MLAGQALPTKCEPASAAAARTGGAAVRAEPVQAGRSGAACTRARLGGGLAEACVVATCSVDIKRTLHGCGALRYIFGQSACGYLWMEWRPTQSVELLQRGGADAGIPQTLRQLDGFISTMPFPDAEVGRRRRWWWPWWRLLVVAMAVVCGRRCVCATVW